MFLNTFLCLIIYFTSEIVAKNVHIPLCATWKTTGTVIIGSKSGQNGSNETSLNLPTAIVAVGENDTLYVVDSGNNRLMKYKNGSNIGEQVNVNNETLDNPQDIAIDESGAIYITEAGRNRVVKWTVDPPSSEVLMSVSSPSGIYLDEAMDELYVVGLHRDGYSAVFRYGEFNSSGGEKVVGDKPPPISFYSLSSLYSPVGIYVDSQQWIYVAESGSHRITRWAAKRTSGATFAGPGNCSSGLSDLCEPTSFILNDTGTVFIADMWHNRILQWTSGATGRKCILGCPIQVGNETTYPLSRPYDITFDSKFNFLVVERDMHQIKRFDFYFELSCMLTYCQPPIVSVKDYPPIQIRSQPIKFDFDALLDCHIWTSTTLRCSVTACYAGDRSCIRMNKLDTLVNSFVQKRTDDSYIMEIPSFGLPVGTYNFSCIMRMTLTGRQSTPLLYTLKIIRSPVVITLLPLGKSKITLGYQQQYTLSPKVSSHDIDPQSMRFVYYCRKYPNFNYITVNGVRLNIDQDSQNATNSTCFNLKVLPESFTYENGSNQSSLTIMSGSLKVNQIYEFYVELYGSEGLVDKSDAILIEIQSEISSLIEVLPVFTTFTLDNDYQLLNPNTQLLLNSSIMDDDALINWKIYTGVMVKDSIILWEEYDNKNISSNQLFYGLNYSFLTATKDLFLNQDIDYWQFVAICTTEDGSGSGSVQLKINHPPVQQYCEIDPIEGYTNQWFTVMCANWTDLDGIKDYFLHVTSMKSDMDILMSIANSAEPMFSVHLPSGDWKMNYQLNLVVHVRDNLNASTESKVMSIKVKPDEQFVNKTTNFTEDLVFDGDENQLINSYSTILNQLALNDQMKLMNNGEVQISDLIISTFETLRANGTTGNLTNATMLFIKNLNRRAIIREYFLNFYDNISIPTTIEGIIILSSTINQLTDTTSEWTQKSLGIASNICNQLSKAIYDLLLTTTIEQVLLIINSLSQCASNVFTGVNGPLQQRGFIFDYDLDKDFFSPKEIEYDYTQYEDYEWLDAEVPHCGHSGVKKDRMCREDIIDGENFNQSVYHNNWELYQQKLLARRLGFEVRETMAFLAKSIRRHLNLFQDLSILVPASRVFVEQVYEQDIEDKFIDLKTRNASIYLPKKLTFAPSYLLGVQAILLPLAPEGGDVGVGLSTALTFAVIGNDDRELEINATNGPPIEMFIPRDINLPIPTFVEENMTTVTPPRYGSWKANRQFFIYYVNITQENPNLTISIHFDLKPIARNISYFILYKLDEIPVYNSTQQSFDSSIMFCDEILTDEMDYYTFYIDNVKTAGHKSLFIGIRELGENDICSIDELPPITDQPYGFLYNYFIRIFSSGCYYLNERGLWKSDGMKVGAMTNFEYTHCYSNHT